MICKATLIGRITNDLVLEKSKNDNNYVRFSIACNTMNQGSMKTCFLNCVSFGNTAENLTNYCSKGSLIFIDGTITQNTYKNKDNVTIRNYTIICNQIRFLTTSSKTRSDRAERNRALQSNPEIKPSANSEIKKDNSKQQNWNKESSETSNGKANSKDNGKTNSKDINFADDIDWGSG